MGLAVGALRLLLAAGQRDPFTGSVVVLGKQDTLITEATLQRCAAAAGVKVRDTRFELSARSEMARKGYLTDESVLRALGFTEYRSLDVSDFEGADVLHDLNSDTAPAALVRACDVVIDLGTLEHVFHVPNALTTIGQMLREGGRAVHLSPASNYLDHGFYMFSPTFFYDYYAANGYEICEVQLVRHTQRSWAEPWEIYEYDPNALATAAPGQLDGGLFCVWCVARKLATSTVTAIPQQRSYVRVWENSGGRPPDSRTTSSSIVTKIARHVLHLVTTLETRRALAQAYADLAGTFRLNRFAFLRGRVRVRVSIRPRNFGLRRVAKY